MIIAKEFPDRQFENKEELFKELRENKADLIATKKMTLKEADAVVFVPPVSDNEGEVIKADTVDLMSLDKIQAELVINTTSLMDSHSDVHIKGIWKKSVKEIKKPYLLQEHRMKFDHIITDEVTASVKVMTWKELGFKFEGDTEALVFDAIISKNRNEFMFDQYAQGFVKEHSVGMRYVSLELAINSESKYDKEEKKVWDKYIDSIANKELAENQGYFWAITQAKIIEGSAVVKGSNFATPTISVEAVSDTSAKSNSNDDDKTEPLKDTQNKANVTVKRSDAKSFMKHL
jgi:hypothetical protein